MSISEKNENFQSVRNEESFLGNNNIYVNFIVHLYSIGNGKSGKHTSARRGRGAPTIKNFPLPLLLTQRGTLPLLKKNVKKK